ncbi:MAG: M20/M25/M40 family metallo-hydrolase [Crocinitomicaceae bacterium]|nr:M20/M25/M40 family metallo-hydrolase [Crocinitomicaceae bacterium]
MRFIFILGCLISAFHGFSQNQLRDDLGYLAQDELEGRSMGSKGEILAANYIVKRFREIGLTKGGTGDTTYFEFFTKKTRLHPHDNAFQGPVLSGRNIIGILDKGFEETIIIGAHYDHLGWGDEGSLHTGEKAIHNGADDNASGVAALLFIAESLKEIPLQTNVIFIAFTGEEKGLLGSAHYVKNHGFDLKTARYMLNMDMVGRLNEKNQLAVNGVGTSPSFVPVLKKMNQNIFHLILDSTGMGPSDHTSFYLDSIPVLHFFTGQHEQYHKPEDDVALINFEGLELVSKYIVSIIQELDKEREIAYVKTRDPEQKRFSFKVTLGVIPDYLFEGEGMKIAGVKADKPAEKAGLQKDDIILKMGDTKIHSIREYMEVLKTLDKGDEVEIEVLRGKNTSSFLIVF